MIRKHLIYFLAFLLISCDKDKITDEPKALILEEATIGGIDLFSNTLVSLEQTTIELSFNLPIPSSSNDYFKLENKTTSTQMSIDIVYSGKLVSIINGDAFLDGNTYELTISDLLRGSNNEGFQLKKVNFSVFSTGPLVVTSFTYNDKPLAPNNTNIFVDLNPTFSLGLSQDLELVEVEKNIKLLDISTTQELSVKLIKKDLGKYDISPLTSLSSGNDYEIILSQDLGTSIGKSFNTVSYLFSTESSELSDEELLTLVQSQTLRYFWDFGHPVSGLARERNTSGDVVTIGGSGFGLMAMIVGVERGFITKEEAIGRWEIMLSFLKNADRFHGAWSHWLNGASGKALPFSAKDNGADLVETAFMIQALITLRQYLNPNDSREANLIERINFLWNAVEWDWFTRGGQKTLYWHWSPDFDWDMNFRISGHNETLITYVLAASSTTHTIDKEVYSIGYARNGNMQNGNTYYGFKLPLGSGRGGPLFFSHYSFLGLDPRNLSDEYANYWQQNTNHTQVNRSYCYANPLNKIGYGKGSWGLTACDGNTGYGAFSPDNDKGVVAPTAALSSMPYTPIESMEVLKRLYYDLGDKMWGPYGFYDAYNESVNWYATSNLAIDQGPIVCMIENHRTGLLWDLFMSAPEIQAGLTKLGFTY